jgi:hypothetical protein
MVCVEVVMIRRQSENLRPLRPHTYFSNFVNTIEDKDLVSELKKYNATLGKCKKGGYAYNVKWHDEKLYMLFVLRHS